MPGMGVTSRFRWWGRFEDAIRNGWTSAENSIEINWIYWVGKMARNHEVGSGSKYLRQRLFLLPFLLQIMNYHEVLANGINLWRRVTTKEAAESIAALPSQPSNAVESSWKFTIQTGSLFIQNGAQTSRWIILMITGRFISGRSIGFYQFLNMFPFFW